MFSKRIKISTFIICTVIYGALIYLLVFTNYIDKLNLFSEDLSSRSSELWGLGNLKRIIDTLRLSTIEKVVGVFFLFGSPVALVFAFMMRGIDWRHKEHEGGSVWLLGAVLAVLYFVGARILWEWTLISNEMDKLHHDTQAQQKTILGILMFVGYVLCILAIFVKQGQAKSSGIKEINICPAGYGGDDPCAYGGCM